MALDRTWYNTLVDDSGSGLDGTIWNKAAVDSLMDVIDAALATLGVWTDVAYNAATFTASTGTWTVDVGDQTALRYTLVGKTMTVAFDIRASDVSATPTGLQIAIPGGHVCATGTRTAFVYQDAGGASALGLAAVLAAGTVIALSKLGGGTWTTTTADNTLAIGQITFEVQ